MLVRRLGTQVRIAPADQGQRRPISDNLRRVAMPGISAIQQRNRGHHLEVRGRSQEGVLPGLVEGVTRLGVHDVGTKHARGRAGSLDAIGDACRHWLVRRGLRSHGSNNPSTGLHRGGTALLTMRNESAFGLIGRRTSPQGTEDHRKDDNDGHGDTDSYWNPCRHSTSWLGNSTFRLRLIWVWHEKSLLQTDTVSTITVSNTRRGAPRD